MTSKCIDDCLNIENDAICIPPSKTYTKLHKWPVAEAELLRSLSHGSSQHRTSMVESISSRQMYLRSYTFSRKEENENRGDQDGDDAGARRNEIRCFGGGKTKKKSLSTSKTTSGWDFVIKLMWKYLSCNAFNKVNVQK